MADYYEYSIPDLIKLLGARFKDYRLRSNMTQKEVSEQSGITITTIHKFENGTSGNMSLGTFLLLMKAIGQIDALDEFMPELPESAYLVKKESSTIDILSLLKYLCLKSNPNQASLSKELWSAQRGYRPGR